MLLSTVFERNVFSLMILILVLSAGAQAQTVPGKQGPTIVDIKRTNSEIVIDGNADEAAWEDAASISLNYERFPDINAEPDVQTQCLVTYDQNNLYVSFKASDPRPDKIRAHFMDRDSRERLMRDDHVGFSIDPFNNEQWSLQFRINPLGVQADAVYSDRRNSTDYSWDAIWASDGTITEDGYVVEVRIPFSSINVPSDSLQNWRFSAFRNYPRSVQHRIRSHPINLNEQSFLAQFNRIRGFENLSSGLNLKLNPVLTAKRTDNNSGSGSGGLDQGSVKLNPGGNVQWGIQPNLNLSATVNPDFSQIEADALQLRENRRFVLSFPEKRPFFLESSEIFETPLNAVFTRSIIEPKGGIKMTGKLGSHSFGTFITQDQSNRILFPSNQSSDDNILNNHSYSGIFRYQTRLKDNGSVGILGEARQSPDSNYRNYVGGVDGYWRFFKSNSLQFQYLQSTTNYGEGIAQAFNQPSDQFGGSALNLDLSHSSRKWAGTAEYTSISSGFRNDNGFLPRANFQTFSASAKRIFRGDSEGWFSSIQFGPAYDVTTDQSGTLTDRSVSFSATYTGPLQSEVFTSYSISKRRFDGRTFAGLDTGVFFFRLQPAGMLSKFRLYSAYGKTVDFTNVRRARELIIHPGLTLNISRKLNIEIDPNYQRLSNNGHTIFNTYLLGTRLMYHFNKKTFVRSILQYRNVDRNLSEFNNPASLNSSTESFFYQLLFSYKINPQSKLFLGYSSGYEGINQHPLQIQTRTGYLKVGYAWVL